MRVLCSTTPMDGVFGPFVPLGRALAEREHDVVVATGSNLQSAVEVNGFEYAQAGLSAWDGFRAAAEDSHVKAAAAGDRIAFPAAMFGRVHPAAKLPALRELAGSRSIDLIVHPPVDLSGPLLAAELGLPTACYGFGQPFDPQVVAAMAERIRPAWESANLQPDPYGGIYRGRYLDPRPPSLRAGDDMTAAGGTLTIRPEIPGDPTATLPPWAATLGERPAVYVSFGTAPLFNQPGKFASLLAGLAELDLEVVVTVSKPQRPSGARQPARQRARRTVAAAGPTATALRCGPLPRRDRHDARRAGRRVAARARATGRRPIRTTRARASEPAPLKCSRPTRSLPRPSATPSAPSLTTVPPKRTEALRLAGEIAAMPPAAQVVEALAAGITTRV